MDMLLRHVKQWDVTTHLCSNLKSGFVEPSVKLEHG